jgi:hypothetical protein
VIPPNYNLPDGVTDADISPETEKEPSLYLDEDEPRERDGE